MTTNTTDLAAALNECMPMSFNGYTYVRAEVATESSIGSLWLRHETGGFITCSQHYIIGILWAECVQRKWCVSLTSRFVTVSTVNARGHLDVHYQQPCTDALAFARAFAAAKRATQGDTK